MSSWDPDADGVLVLPSGLSVRGRGVRRPMPPGDAPEYGLYLLGRPPAEMPWPSNWIRWPDFGLPVGRARDLLREAYARAVDQRVEIACGGGNGRTGTALACLAVLDGVPASDAVQYVRTHYSRHAVETPWQRRYVRQFDA